MDRGRRLPREPLHHDVRRRARGRRRDAWRRRRLGSVRHHALVRVEAAATPRRVRIREHRDRRDAAVAEDAVGVVAGGVQVVRGLQQALVAYQQSVLEAAQEVDDAMVSLSGAQAEEAILVEAVEAARRSNDLSMLQYKEGFSGYQRVLDAQKSLFSQQNRYAATQGQAVQSLVALYKALGGGWEVREGRPFVDENTLTVMRERTNWGDILNDQ